MPIQIIVAEGVLTAVAQADAFRKLTELLLAVEEAGQSHAVDDAVRDRHRVAPVGSVGDRREPARLAAHPVE